MDRTDAEQEGITLGPQFTAKLIAEAAARKEILEHIGLCPFASSKIDERIRTLETSFARLTGFMLGSGILGGAAGAVAAKMMGQ